MYLLPGGSWASLLLSVSEVRMAAMARTSSECTFKVWTLEDLIWLPSVSPLPLIFWVLNMKEKLRYEGSFHFARHISDF